jgi:hypothetical protein
MLFIYLNKQLTATTSLLLILLFGLLLFSYSIFCGIWLLKGGLKKGLLLSSINQMFQVVNLSILNFSFSYISGFGIQFNIDLTSTIKFIFDFKSSNFVLLIESGKDTIFFGINFLALYLIYFIEKIKLES